MLWRLPKHMNGSLLTVEPSGEKNFPFASTVLQFVVRILHFVRVEDGEEILGEIAAWQC